MYLSRTYIDVAQAGGMRLASSPYRMHAAIEASFPPDARRDVDEGRILWRLDASAQNAQVLTLYVVSPDKPDFSHIVEQAGPCAAGAGESKDYAPLLDMLSEGQVWRFRLKANTARMAMVDKGVAPHEGIVGKLQGHVTVEHQVEWLQKRCAPHGFSLVGSIDDGRLMVRSHQKERFRREGKEVTLATAVFDGVLQVDDAVLFRNALCHGIGRAKGFGCGLMTIVPYSC